VSLERVCRYRGLRELTISMAGRLVQRLADLQAEKPVVHMALTGGATVQPMYAALGNLAQTTALDPSRLELWWNSERYVPTTDLRRNSTQALTQIARSLPIVSAKVHPMPSSTGTSDPDEAAYIYAKELGDVTFDICLLGVGCDGHVASIYPDHPSMRLQSETTLSAIGVTNAPRDPPERVTLTLNTINRSSEVWLLASGTQKADIIARALRHDQTIPAGLVHGADTTYWFLDLEAAEKLPYYHCRF